MGRAKRNPLSGGGGYDGFRLSPLPILRGLSSGGTLKIIAAIEESPLITQIFSHLGLPARAPPRYTAQHHRTAGFRFDFHYD
jgi:hypothetical protein